MNEIIRSHQPEPAASSDASHDEESRLEFALHDPDRLLTESLRVDERRRRVRRFVYVTLVVGGIVMGTTLMAVLAGWLTFFTPPPAEQATTAEQAETKKAWVERLGGLRDHMHTAFGVGPDLTLLEPDEGLAIVREAWPKIEAYEVKTGLLKTFAFSKALPKKHSQVLQVLHLGMTDKDPKVREYAAAYVEEYAGRNFASDSTAYKAWYRKNREQDPNELLEQRQTAASEGLAQQPAPRNREAAIARAEQLAGQGWELWKQQSYREAAEQFEQAVALNPESANAWNGLGWARFNGGNGEGAVEAFEKCVELERDHPAGLNGLGQVYLNWGDFEKAEQYLLKAAKSPHASAAWFGLARLYLLTGEFEKAQRWIRRSLREQPGEETLKAMLDAARKKELPDDLRRRLEPVGKPDSSPAAQAAVEGWRQFNQGQLRSAERSFNRALAKDPENLSAMNGLGFLLLNTGKTAEAKQYFEKCLKVEPDSAGPMNGLARCLKAEGKIDEAIALWEKMHEKYPGPNAAAVGLATTYLERKEYDKAVTYFEELVKATPDNEEFQKGLEAAKKGAEAKSEE